SCGSSLEITSGAPFPGSPCPARASYWPATLSDVWCAIRMKSRLVWSWGSSAARCSSTFCCVGMHMSLESLAITNRVPQKTLSLSRPAKITLLLSLFVALTIFAFMTVDVKGNWDFVIPFRGTKIAAMALVGYAIAVATVLFQTITNNRILTPSVMGFDAMYVLIQTALVFLLGTQRMMALSPQLRFVIEVVLMVSFAALLYRWLFGGPRRSLYLLVLCGLIFGVLFRSLASFMQRIIDPNEFAVLQDMLFASFNSFDRDLLVVSVVLVFAASAVAWRIRHTFDVLTLGRETAIS